MKTFQVNNYNELHEALSKYRKSKGWVFRGQLNLEWKLLPKAGRDPFDKVDDKIWFESWKRRAIEFVTSPIKDDWVWLSIAQHHGLATRLLDWTYNPLFAAFFAVSGKSDTDSIIYCYNPHWTVCPENCEPFDRDTTALFSPRGVVPRIIRQSGVFTIHHSPSTPLEESLDFADKLERVIINRKYKKELLFELDYYGINEYTVFSSLDGLSSYLNWYISNSSFIDSKDAFYDDKKINTADELV